MVNFVPPASVLQNQSPDNTNVLPGRRRYKPHQLSFARMSQMTSPVELFCFLLCYPFSWIMERCLLRAKIPPLPPRADVHGLSVVVQDASVSCERQHPIRVTAADVCVTADTTLRYDQHVDASDGSDREDVPPKRSQDEPELAWSPVVQRFVSVDDWEEVHVSQRMARFAALFFVVAEMSFFYCVFFRSQAVCPHSTSDQYTYTYPVYESFMSTTIIEKGVFTFLVVSCNTLYYFLAANESPLHDPGTIPIDCRSSWKCDDVSTSATPAPSSSDLIISAETVEGQVIHLPTEALGPCRKCGAAQPIRAYHCRRCGRCCARYDHHCFWLGSCVGQRNYGAFFALVWCMTIGCLYASTYLWHSLGDPPPFQCSDQHSSERTLRHYLHLFYHRALPTVTWLAALGLGCFMLLVSIVHCVLVSHELTTYEFGSSHRGSRIQMVSRARRVDLAVRGREAAQRSGRSWAFDDGVVANWRILIFNRESFYRFVAAVKWCFGIQKMHGSSVWSQPKVVRVVNAAPNPVYYTEGSVLDGPDCAPPKTFCNAGGFNYFADFSRSSCVV